MTSKRQPVYEITVVNHLDATESHPEELESRKLLAGNFKNGYSRREWAFKAMSEFFSTRERDNSLVITMAPIRSQEATQAACELISNGIFKRELDGFDGRLVTLESNEANGFTPEEVSQEVRDLTNDLLDNISNLDK